MPWRAGASGYSQAWLKAASRAARLPVGSKLMALIVKLPNPSEQPRPFLGPTETDQPVLLVSSGAAVGEPPVMTRANLLAAQQGPGTTHVAYRTDEPDQVAQVAGQDEHVLGEGRGRAGGRTDGEGGLFCPWLKLA